MEKPEGEEFKPMRFRYKFVPSSLDSVAARDAVLTPLAGQAISEQDVKDKTTRVVDMWRKRVDELHQTEWSGLKPPAKPLLLKNCCPATAAVQKKTYVCNRRHVCPWCYARRVQEVFLRIDSVWPDLYKGELEETAKREQLQKTGLSSSEPVSARGINFMSLDEFDEAMDEEAHDVTPSPTTSKIDEDSPAANYSLYVYERNLRPQLWADVQKVFDNVRQMTREKRIDPINPHAALSVTTLEPGNDGGYKMSLRYLYMLDGNSEIPADLRASDYRGPTRSPSRLQLQQAVSRVCRYPTGLMHGDAQRATRCLKELKSRRLTEYFRAFRMSRKAITSAHERTVTGSAVSD